MTKEIPLTRGMVALVDDEDYAELSKHKWYAAPGRHTFYAERQVRVFIGRQRKLGMHRALMGDPHGMEIDHINGNGLDNRRRNLRIVTSTQNGYNKNKTISKTTSRYKGVALHGKNWRAYIYVDQKRYDLGTYELEEDAARAYDKAAREHFGGFAKTNF